jgi:hypothetical protein
MSLSRSQIQSWNPSTLTRIGDGWLSMGSRIEGAFDRYRSAVTKINDGHWEGVAAEAALHRADSDRRAAVRLVDHLERVAKIANDGFHAISAPLQRARDAIADAERAGFTVSENLAVSKTGNVTPEQQQAKRQWQTRITDAAKDTESADYEVKRQLNAARADLRAAFISPAALGSDQARTDARQLLGDPSHMTPTQIMRLVEAGSLTSEQLEALQSGESLDIPASQMEYINTLARSLDGKSPQDIENMLNQLPPDARQGVANALQLLSTQSVRANVHGDAEIPTTGAASLLPEKMHQSLTRNDLVHRHDETYRDGSPVEVFSLNGVAENQAIARIADMSDPQLKHGTGLDVAVLDTARTYLDAQVDVESNPDRALEVDGDLTGHPGPVTEEMFSAVADDRAAVADAVSHPHDALLSDVFKHEWTDDGKAVSSMFDISPEDAVGDPGNRPDEVRAEQSAEIAEKVAHYMSNNVDGNDRLLHLAPTSEGDTPTTVGDRNPDLIRGVADGLTPYYSTLAGSETMDVRYIKTADGLANMYAVLASDPVAGVQAAEATIAQEHAMARAFGAGDGYEEYGQIAGQMHHALEMGTTKAWEETDAREQYAADWHHAVSGSKFETAQAAASVLADSVPYGKPVSLFIDMVGPEIENGLSDAIPKPKEIPDPEDATDPEDAKPVKIATGRGSDDTFMTSMLNGVAAQDPSIVTDPALNELRSDPDGRPYLDREGDPYLTVEGVEDQRTVREFLGSRYIDPKDPRNIDPKDWLDFFTHGMDINNEISPVGRR